MIVKGKNVLITGASSGIGKDCAEVFAEAGANVILLARRVELIRELAEMLIKTHHIRAHFVKCDVSNFSEVEQAISTIPGELLPIDILINNAGGALGLSKIYEGNIDDWDGMIGSNIKGLLYVTRLILPEMVKRNEGLVINISSIAGLQVYPNGNVYCAVKAAASALSQSMIIDLNGTNVKVTNIDPGLTRTEFALTRYHGDAESAGKVYHGYTPLMGRDIAEIALFCATRPKHVNIQEILVTPTDQATTTIVSKKL